MTNKTTIYVFDVDGTITDKDSFFELIKWYQPNKLHQLSTWLKSFIKLPLAFITKNISLLKYQILAILFKGKSKEDLAIIGQDFYAQVFKEDIFDEARNYIEALKQQNSRVVLVSASCRFWLQPLADDLGVDLICSELAFDNQGLFTGQPKGKNCIGEAKIEALVAKYPQDTFEYICFGNSESDRLQSRIAKAYHHLYFQNMKKV